MTKLPDATRWPLWLVALGFFMQARVIALPALIFIRVPDDTQQNAVLRRRTRRSR
jgi:hypothetical protein